MAMNFDDRIRKARVQPPDEYYLMVDKTLANLPRTRMAGAKNQLSTRRIVAICIIAALLLASIPVVYAAMPFLRELFAGEVQRIEEEQARPTQARIEQAIESEREYGYYEQDFENATVQVGDIRATLPGVSLFPAEIAGEYDLAMTLEFTGNLEGFDPAWLDITLHVDGRNISMSAISGYEAYRREGIANNSSHLYSPWYMDGETCKLTLFFPIGELSLEDPIEMSLSGDLHRTLATGAHGEEIGPMRIDFTFDTMVAMTQDSARQEALLVDRDQAYDDEKIRLTELALEAVEINAFTMVGDVTVVANEMSIVDGMMYFTASIHNGAEFEKGITMVFDGVRIDGMAFPRTGGFEPLKAENGVQKCIYSQAIGRDVRKLPDASLFYLALDGYEGEGIIFKYNWQTKEVALPIDQEQEQQWKREEATMAREKQVNWLVSSIYYPQVSDTQGGTTVSIDKVRISDKMEIILSINGKDVKEPDSLRPYNITIEGQPVQNLVSSGLFSCSFVMPLHPTELGEEIPMVISFPVTFTDGTSETYSFSFVLVRDDAAIADGNRR